MKRWLVVGMVALWSLAVAAPVMAQAVNFRFGGWFRYRGNISDNQDRLDTVRGTDTGRDLWKIYTYVFRPYFIATMEDKARVFFQLDIPKFNAVGGGDCAAFGTGCVGAGGNEFSRTSVNLVVANLQVKVPHVPGNWFVKMGRDNVFLPRGLIGRLPNLREFGIQAWGTAGIFKPRFEIYKRNEHPNGSATSGLDFADDDDVYIVKVPFTPMKGVRIMPYLTIWEQNRTLTQNAVVRQYYTAVEASARYKMFTGKLDFIYQNGDIDWNQAGIDAGNSDKDVSAFVLWLQGGVTLGAANVSVNYVMASGDKDQNDGDENQFFGIGCSPVTGDTGCDARAQGPTDIWFGDKYNDNMIAGSRNIGGNTGGTGGRYARGNGIQAVSVDVSYRARQNVLLQATVGAIWSYFARPDLTTDGSTPFVDDRYIGTEVDLSATWTIYKGVSFTGGFDYLIAGDYGKLRTPVAAQSQVPGGSNRQVNDNDDSWQAVWKLQWAF